MPTNLAVNGRLVEVKDDPRTPLLWVLRDSLGLTGTKFGCGIAHCGACTVMMEGEAIRSCVTPIERVLGKRITTIEGLSSDNSHPVQKAWIEEQVAQCGYCQPGMIMEACALLAAHKSPTESQIEDAMGDHVCRCGTYVRIRKAIRLASTLRKS